jgi:hypothetical protein
MTVLRILKELNEDVEKVKEMICEQHGNSNKETEKQKDQEDILELKNYD